MFKDYEIFMSFEFTQDEILEIDTLLNHLEAECARKGIISVLGNNYAQKLFSEFGEKMIAIRSKARTRTLLCVPC